MLIVASLVSFYTVDTLASRNAPINKEMHVVRVSRTDIKYIL